MITITAGSQSHVTAIVLQSLRHVTTLTVEPLTLATAIRVWSSPSPPSLPFLPPSLPSSLPSSLSSPIHSLRCYLKLGDWRTQLDERGQPGSSIAPILQYFKRATEYDGGWYKAWHAWAFMNFQAVLEYKQATTQATAGKCTCWGLGMVHLEVGTQFTFRQTSIAAAIRLALQLPSHPHTLTHTHPHTLTHTHTHPHTLTPTHTYPLTPPHTHTHPLTPTCRWC